MGLILNLLMKRVVLLAMEQDLRLGNKRHKLVLDLPLALLLLSLLSMPARLLY
jgi:hypothetical protein